MTSRRAQKQVPNPASQPSLRFDSKAVIALLSILLLTIITFQPLFDAGKQFTNWDDDDYVTQQSLVRSMSDTTIKRMFDTDSPVSSNYHPLTMLSLAWDVQRGGVAMKPIMQTTLALHVLNTALVFLFIYGLFQRNLLVACTVASLFAIHPMHVESVAWVSERKDVLYSLFYIAACITYLLYARSNSIVYGIATFALFILSCLSKPMAVTLPIVLLLLDFYTGRFRQSPRRALVEKLPLLVVSVCFGLLTVDLQSSGTPGLVDVTNYGIPTRFVLAGYGVVQY
ncbi:MAG: glycosyltransferase family 39 protein, partial [Candidatus Kapabacteria bacterium]|nr:glycosyltransferase family 39 protein [Candidatus Kapabacteria bacterium]